MKMKNHLQANRLACKFFIEQLRKNEDAKRYLRGRVSEDTIKNFGLGYAPRHGLVDLFKEHNLEDQARRLGLINDDFEPFSDRITIPIVHAGWIVGFGARTLSGSVKYVNSPASFLFNKKEILYGLHQSRKRINKRGFAVLVEGYFDVMSLYAHGVGVIAACGTSIDISGAKILSRWTKKVKIVFDGDEAGRKASVKAKRILEHEFLDVQIARLPNGIDPDMYMRDRKMKNENNGGQREDD